MTMTFPEALALWHKGVGPDGRRVGTTPGVIAANHRFLLELTPEGKGLAFLTQFQRPEELELHLQDAYYGPLALGFMDAAGQVVASTSSVPLKGQAGIGLDKAGDFLESKRGKAVAAVVGIVLAVLGIGIARRGR